MMKRQQQIYNNHDFYNLKTNKNVEISFVSLCDNINNNHHETILIYPFNIRQQQRPIFSLYKIFFQFILFITNKKFCMYTNMNFYQQNAPTIHTSHQLNFSLLESQKKCTYICKYKSVIVLFQFLIN